MDENKKSIKLEVVFEADDDAALAEAIESFFEDMRFKRNLPGNASSMSTGGWRYKTAVSEADKAAG